MKSLYQKCCVSRILLGIVALLIIVSNASAGLTVQGVLYRGSAEKGQTITHSMILSCGDQDPETEYTIEVMGLANALEGGVIAVPAVNDSSPYSARTFISLDKSSIRLKPKQPQTVTATIAVPSTVGSGGRYATIYILSKEPEIGMVTVRTSVIVPVLITILNTEQITAGSILEVSAGESVSGQPAYITTTLKNTGNYHYRFINEVKISDSNGKIVFIGSKNASGSLFPTFSMLSKVPIEQELVVGTYTISSKMTLEDGTSLDEESISFEMKKAYKPPFADVSSTISPRTAGTLVSSDNIVVIQFPQGAVFDDTKVTLKSLRIEHVPEASPGITLGATVFSIEGISGLLSKDATITVKYSTDDLAITGGDAGKLKLGRYDNVDMKWVPLTTKVDQGAGTLSVTTNRLSTWAVMTGEAGAGTADAEGTRADGFTALIACGAIGILFIANWFKRR